MALKHLTPELQAKRDQLRQRKPKRGRTRIHFFLNEEVLPPICSTARKARLAAIETRLGSRLSDRLLEAVAEALLVASPVTIRPGTVLEGVEQIEEVLPHLLPDAASWSRVLALAVPEEYLSCGLPESNETAPGTLGRVTVYERRFAGKLDLHHPLDKVESQGRWALPGHHRGVREENNGDCEDDEQDLRAKSTFEGCGAVESGGRRVRGPHFPLRIRDESL